MNCNRGRKSVHEAMYELKFCMTLRFDGSSTSQEKARRSGRAVAGGGKERDCHARAHV